MLHADAPTSRSFVSPHPRSQLFCDFPVALPSYVKPVAICKREGANRNDGATRWGAQPVINIRRARATGRRSRPRCHSDLPRRPSFSALEKCRPNSCSKIIAKSLAPPPSLSPRLELLLILPLPDRRSGSLTRTRTPDPQPYPPKTTNISFREAFFAKCPPDAKGRQLRAGPPKSSRYATRKGEDGV